MVSAKWDNKDPVQVLHVIWIAVGNGLKSQRERLGLNHGKNRKVDGVR
jgi:hypothetical protein